MSQDLAPHTMCSSIPPILLSIMELQVLIFELISQFEFSPSPENYEVMRAPAGLMLPMIRDKMEMGLQMPLKVTPV